MVKEVRFTARTEENDLMIKARISGHTWTAWSGSDGHDANCLRLSRRGACRLRHG